MPLDLSSSRKIYPDATYGFKWEHKTSGSIAANTFFILSRVGTCTGIANHAQAKAQGYSCTNTDWRDTEQKVYFDADTGSQYLTLFLGGLGSEGSPCSGCGYEASFSSNGIVQLRKKTYHIQYNTMARIDNGPLPSGFKGVAFLRYNVERNSAVKLEAWVDKGTNNNWKHVITVIDNGFNHGSGGSRCGTTDKETLTWGYPVVGFSAPFSYNYQNMTARTINPSGSFNEAQIAGGLARPRGGGGGTPLPATATG